jgi:hypothetical protein
MMGMSQEVDDQQDEDVHISKEREAPVRRGGYVPCRGGKRKSSSQRSCQCGLFKKPIDQCPTGICLTREPSIPRLIFTGDPVPSTVALPVGCSWVSHRS